MGASNSSSSESSDLELIRRYKETLDKEFVGLLFYRYQHQILAVCVKYLHHVQEAEDASMDIFEELLEKLLEHEVKVFKSWLLTLARNHCLMKIRKNKGIVELDVQSEKIENQFMETVDFEHLIDEKQDESEVLHAAIAQLKDGQRECIRLFYLKGLSYHSISAETGFDVKQVKSNIQNGKRNLQIFLSGSN